MALQTLKHPELLQIQTETGISLGADQDWYDIKWKRDAGCGPTTCSHLMRYLAETRPGCRTLAAEDTSTKAGFIKLMDAVWNYVTPGFMGMNHPRRFCMGGLRYAKNRGTRLQCRMVSMRRPFGHFTGYRKKCTALLQLAMQQDVPVAFLNLSHGALETLESWHWVTVIGFDKERMELLVLDNTQEKILNLQLWLETARIGGGFVALLPREGVRYEH